MEIDDEGRVGLPIGLLAAAGLSPGSPVVAFSRGDGRIVLRRAEDAMRDLVEKGSLT